MRLFNLLEGISISSNISSKQLKFVSIVTSLFLGLKESLVLNQSVTRDCSSFLKRHISLSFLPYSSISVFNFTWSILLAVGINFKLLFISEAERFLLERFITFLITNLHSNLNPICEKTMLLLFKTSSSFS